MISFENAAKRSPWDRDEEVSNEVTLANFRSNQEVSIIFYELSLLICEMIHREQDEVLDGTRYFFKIKKIFENFTCSGDLKFFTHNISCFGTGMWMMFHLYKGLYVISQVFQKIEKQFKNCCCLARIQ